MKSFRRAGRSQELGGPPEGSGGPSGGQERLEPSNLSQPPGHPSRQAGRGQEALWEGQDGSDGSLGGTGGISRPLRRAGKGRDALPKG